MSLTDEVKPCPFCGCHGVKYIAHEYLRHTIKCEDCPGQMECYSSSKEQAIAAWNRRAIEAEVTKPQEPVAIYHGVMDCGEFGAFNLEILKMIPRGANLYTTPQPCQSCAEKQSAIDVWEGRYADLSAKYAELRVEADFNFQQYQDLGAVALAGDLTQESKFNQLCQDMDRMTAQRDILQSRIDTTRKFLEFLWRDAQLNDYTFGRLEEILATLNLAAMN